MVQVRVTFYVIIINFFKILTSVLLVLLITVILMLTVPTLLVASPAPVTKDTLEMEIHAIVSGTSYDILMHII